MNKEGDYASDSDQSDEDFCVEKAAGESCSEVESEDSEASNSEQDDDDGEQSGKGRKTPKKNRSKTVKPDKETEIIEGSTRRCTRQTDTERNGKINTAHEKDELESDEETEKSRTDALWADFLGEVNTSKANKPQAKVEQATASEKPANINSKPEINQQEDAKNAKKPKEQTIVEILDFAGEAVCVEKTLSKDSVKENKTNPTPSRLTTVTASTTRAGLGGLKRPALTGAPSAGGGGGLGSILNQLGKKKKMSVLEKSQLDWKSFKQDEGIDEELQTFNKGKDGFLERQDFLQRTDLRQFEIEKSLRQTRRQN